MKITTKDIAYTGMFTALIAIGAFIKIPLPGTPLTLQPLFVFLAGMLLGGRRATLALTAYVLIGLSGIPIFTNGGGIGYILEPSFGYLLGFIAAAACIGYSLDKIEHPTFWQYLGIGMIGMVIIYAIGLPYLYLILRLYLGKTLPIKTLLLTYCLFLLPKDIISCSFAAYFSRYYGKKLK
ncbi:biotin transporter BioY [Erysipelotrichaceae bacterium]|nr:biotin transporter BioY [Erysipelotrichaceae bacterium]